MKITDLQAYKDLEKIFWKKGYLRGVKDEMPIYYWEDTDKIPDSITPGHYVSAISNQRIKFKDIPREYRTREFFLHALSGVKKDIVEYVKSHPEEFDRQFFKDHIETNYVSLEFKNNDFEYMPLEFIDEEMALCAMFKSIDMRYVERRGECDDWFYSVYRRKPEVLTKELYILGARCFAEKINGENKFLKITPEQYKTPEYYFALCLANDTQVMEDIPESILTTQFLNNLLKDNSENIRSFSKDILERETCVKKIGKVKYWQAAVIKNGYQIRNIPLNEERIEFFMTVYDKDSSEYEYGFKQHYKNYIREKGLNTMSTEEIAKLINENSQRVTVIPIRCNQRVPLKYAKKYDKEEYLLEIYKKLGIKVLKEFNYYYYSVILPENISIDRENTEYYMKNSNKEVLMHYYDRGPFYDRTVLVNKINVTL